MLHKWGIVPSAACPLCGHPAKTVTQSHIQCLCPALKEARIRAHHNMAHRLWKGIQASTEGWVIAIEQTVEGLLGLLCIWKVSGNKANLMPQLSGKGQMRGR